MNAQQFKNSILQYAMQGKLVPQDPNDEPATELLQQIYNKKEQLIQKKEIQKEKPFLPINEEEVPFDVPESWKWVRIGEILSLRAGKNIKALEISNEKTNEYKYPCYGGNGIRGYVRHYNHEGQYALIGRQGALCGNINFAQDKFYATEHAVVVNHLGLINFKWSGYFLKALNLNQYATATAQPGLAVSNIVNKLIPLPPINEQQSIVAAIEALFTKIDSFEKLQFDYKKLQINFPSKLENSILHFAMQGKLVKQNPNDEPAAELIKYIDEEKTKLIKTKVIKKEKDFLPMTEEEIPFDIPESWEWVRLGEIVQLISGRDLTPSEYNALNEGIPYITGASNFKNGKLDIVRWTSNPKVITKEKDLLITCKGTIGEMAIQETSKAHIARQVMALRIIKSISPEYIQLCLQDLIKDLKNSAKSMIPGISRKDILNLKIPLPPLEEQDRIIAKVNDLSDVIKKNI